MADSKIKPVVNIRSPKDSKINIKLYEDKIEKINSEPTVSPLRPVSEPSAGRELRQGSVQAESERLAQPPSQLRERFPPWRGRLSARQGRQGRQLVQPAPRRQLDGAQVGQLVPVNLQDLTVRHGH